ncbi:choice-of-anchor B family protein [Aquimarina agarilytica]|uniref:choice-of-anchor B family protein n=1 Tax=Aquimarina agarilytica TaxID=1087449 RepID=UPI000289D5A3|nr:choice-of-anchor B family protein [Aquimarina agarilytica]
MVIKSGFLFSKWMLAVGLMLVFINCSSDDTTIVPPPTVEDPVTEEPIITDPIGMPNPEESTKRVICENGFAGIYPCNGYDLMSNVSLKNLGFTQADAFGNDIWGWTDTTTQKEYAIVGAASGTAFVDVSDPLNPIVKGKLPTATENSSWRDIKVYDDHAFIVSEAQNHGMQVFDLTKLRSEGVNQTFSADATFNEFGSAHNIVINESENYAYINGTSRDIFGGGAVFVDVSNPKSPKGVGGYSADGYSHDAQVVTYSGPDADYQGKEIYIGSNEDEVVIVDVTDKNNPIKISEITYSNFKYTHQGWFTEDQTYFLLGDELDEQEFGFKTRTIVFDFTDLDAPKIHMEYSGPTNAIDHNGYVNGNLFYLANYVAGIRIIDVSDIANKNMTEVGFFDSVPNSNSASFGGVWSVYPFFKSGSIIFNDSQKGLFVVKKSE